MTGFAVLEPGESIARCLVGRFGPAVRAEDKPRLLVVGPGGELPPGRELLECGTVLLPGGAGEVLEQVRAGSAVSYGLSRRDTITLSSQSADRLWVAVQRELVRVDGTVLDRQEVPVRLPREMEAMQLLALTGAMLLLGVRPEELSLGSDKIQAAAEQKNTPQ